MRMVIADLRKRTGDRKRRRTPNLGSWKDGKNLSTKQARPKKRGAPLILYVLASLDGKRTYVGVTNKIRRRIRQHNGELSGGAKATRGRLWRVAAIAEGFASDRAALSVEKIIHNKGRAMVRRDRSKPVLERRIECVESVLEENRPAKFVGTLKVIPPTNESDDAQFEKNAINILG